MDTRPPAADSDKRTEEERDYANLKAFFEMADRAPEINWVRREEHKEQREKRKAFDLRFLSAIQIDRVQLQIEVPANAGSAKARLLPCAGSGGEEGRPKAEVASDALLSLYKSGKR
eukprot:7462486-Alexandrium_andersonii.AAC.1